MVDQAAQVDEGAETASRTSSLARVEAYSPYDCWVVVRSMGSSEAVGPEALRPAVSATAQPSAAAPGEGGPVPGTVVEAALPRGDNQPAAAEADTAEAVGARRAFDAASPMPSTPSPSGDTAGAVDEKRSKQLRTLVRHQKFEGCGIPCPHILPFLLCCFLEQLRHMSNVKRLIQAKQNVLTFLMSELGIQSTDAMDAFPSTLQASKLSEARNRGASLSFDSHDDHDEAGGSSASDSLYLLAAWNATLGVALEPELANMRRLWAEIASAAKEGASRAQAGRAQYGAASAAEQSSSVHESPRKANAEAAPAFSTTSAVAAPSSVALPTELGPGFLSSAISLPRPVVPGLTKREEPALPAAAAPSPPRGFGTGPTPPPPDVLRGQSALPFVTSAGGLSNMVLHEPLQNMLAKRARSLLPFAIPQQRSGGAAPAISSATEKSYVEDVVHFAVTLQVVLATLADSYAAAGEGNSKTVAADISAVWPLIEQRLEKLRPRHDGNQESWRELEDLVRKIKKRLTLAQSLVTEKY